MLTKTKRFQNGTLRRVLFAMTLCAALNQGVLHAEQREELSNPATSGMEWFPENNGANPASSTGAQAMLPQSSALVAEGKASYYASKFQGRKTANGEYFSLSHFTAAHRTLPFGTTVKVINLENGKTVVVRINDRGPYLHGRIIDVSPAAAREIGLVRSGVANVRIEAYNENTSIL